MPSAVTAALCAGLALCAKLVQAADVTICYNYGCSAKSDVHYSDAQLAPLERRLTSAANAAEERAAVSWVIGRMYAIAGEQTPIWRDKGGNYADEMGSGKMDCIDHSTDTTAFLRLLAARGGLRFHEVMEPLKRRRFIFAEHWGAGLRERQTQKTYVVDSWFFDNGHPAAVMPVEDWLAGMHPNAQ